MKTAFDYKQELDRLTFTQEEKEAMTARLLSAVPGKNTRRQSKGLRRGIVAAVAAAACLTVAAGATGLLKLPSTAFAPVFGAAETEIGCVVRRQMGPVTHQEHPHFPAAPGQQPGCSHAIAAIVAGAGKHRRPSPAAPRRFHDLRRMATQRNLSPRLRQ